MRNLFPVPSHFWKFEAIIVTVKLSEKFYANDKRLSLISRRPTKRGHLTGCTECHLLKYMSLHFFANLTCHSLKCFITTLYQSIMETSFYFSDTQSFVPFQAVFSHIFNLTLNFSTSKTVYVWGLVQRTWWKMDDVLLNVICSHCSSLVLFLWCSSLSWTMFPCSSLYSGKLLANSVSLSEVV